MAFFIKNARSDHLATFSATFGVTEWISGAAGQRIALDRWGPADGPRVVLMHGGGQTRHSWSGLSRRLSTRGYQVINFDAAGHGESDWAADRDYSLDRRAGDLEAILADDCRPYALVGASLGGATAIHAIWRGARPVAVVLVDVVPNAEQVGIDRINAFMRSAPDGFASLEDAAEAVAAYNPDRPRPATSDGLRRNLVLRADGRLHWHWDPAILDQPKNEMRRVLARSAECLATLPDLKVLLVRGLRSDVVSDASVDRFRAQLPTLDVVDIAGAGHMVAGDRNDAFSDAVLTYLDDHLPAEGSNP